ncbi:MULTISPECIES: hypothetical protein [unclassified Caballeronia]|uniref:hypothetical protein n=1 Tax=unclassified Caballeronia TaxID=2646786 RepID=UPI002027B210|nr:MULTISPECIES: hypothetical protein [unclassified Caballeronia]
MTDTLQQRKPFLRLVTSASAAETPHATTPIKPKAPIRRQAKARGTAESDYPLRAILDIEVSWVSKKTIEQMCHLNTPEAELTHQQRGERRLLGDYGLKAKPAIGSLPPAIVLENKRWFRKSRPELKHLANLLEESGGVVPYTPGCPRITQKFVPPAPMSQTGTPLLAVLQAKLTPELTVEDACHLRILDEDDDVPTAEQFLEHVRLFRESGLNASPVFLDMSSGTTIPPAIVLRDEKIFAATFPELAHLIPLMKEVGGVVPYTRGLPRIMKPSTSLKLRAERHLRVVPANPA